MIRILIILFCFYSSLLNAQNWRDGDYHHPWSDSVLKTLNLKECIAQTMMIPAWSNKGPEHIAQVEELVASYRVGGIIFFQGDPLSQVYLTNYLQQNAKVPLLIGIDGEWGAAMRLSGIDRFPYQMTMGAMDNDYLLYQMGWSMGEQCKRMGIHINFAPVVDVNTNEANPIIGFRSFGDNPDAVGHKASIIMNGMQDAGILACAKHFPGHGDTEFDSHLGLPSLSHTKQRFNEIELVPFRTIINQGVQSMMVAHLSIPSLEPDPNVPSSLSPNVVQKLLKNDLGFKGLVITDALNMGGVKKHYAPGYAELAAIKAGNDILCFPENVPKAIDLIYSAIQTNELDSNDIIERARKILFFKHLAGLDKTVYTSTAHVMQDLKQLYPTKLVDSVAASAITIARDIEGYLPLKKDGFKTAVWQIGKDHDSKSEWIKALKSYENSDVYFTNNTSDWASYSKVLTSLSAKYDRVIISVHDQAVWGASARKLNDNCIKAIKTLDEKLIVIPVLFSQPYVLGNLQDIKCAVVCYEDLSNFYQAAADIIYGTQAARGVLPVSVGKKYISGAGVFTYNKIPQMKISNWETEGFKFDFTKNIEDVLADCIRLGAAPGGQVLVARNGHIVYEKSFGYLTYDGRIAVNSGHLYDIASITKIASTTLAAMKLYEQGLLDLDGKLSDYLPQAVNTNKANIKIRNLLLHEAGLVSWIPFYRQAIIDGGVFSPVKDKKFNVQISNYCFMDSKYMDDMWQQIWNSEIQSPGRYVYSDLSMILLQQCIETITKTTLDDYVNRTFFKPMSLHNIAFKPINNFSAGIFAPSMDDLDMRFGTVQGYVHDPAASMFGGVSGHAGLFANSQDLAVVMQMLLNQGSFNGIQFLKPETINYFTRKQYGSQRGLGFDKPNGRYGSRSNVVSAASSATFGHSGFTGTWAWVDPKENLVFIMLTNRTYPDQENGRLVKYNIRGRTLEAVYKALP
jgi:beta-glucosidase-like glycosyl hydrolase/CubicO group peptidase (beta-lactamase class C family)